MSEITVFAFESSAVRTMEVNGEPWFVATDIAKILGFTHTPHMVRMLDEDEKGVQIVDTTGGKRELSIISESGLYASILKSRRPEAKKFRKWVTAEVLPSIRKHGSYASPSQNVAAVPNDRSEQRVIYPMHEADKVVQSDRVFRATLRSARATGLREEQALNVARSVAAEVTGMDLAGAMMKHARTAMPKPAAEGIELFMVEWSSGNMATPYRMESDVWDLFNEYAAWCEENNFRQYSEEGFTERRWRELWPLRKQEIEERKAKRALLGSDAE